MASGDFMYAEESVTYNAATYATTKDWAYAVHVARCKAFYYATQKGADTYYGGYWNTDNTVEDLEEYVPYDPDDPDSYMLPIFIQDLNKDQVDLGGNYPAFYTVFENGRSYTQYAIITARGFTNQNSWASDISRGLYIPSDMLAGNGTYKFVPIDLAHMFGCNGIQSCQNIKAGTLGIGELPVSTPYGVNFIDTTTTTSTSTNSNGIIQNPTEGVTYTFGYAVKDLAIECFYKNSLFQSNTGMLWSLIGNIFTGELGYDEQAQVFSKFPFGYINLYRNGQSEITGLSTNQYTFYTDHTKVDCDCLCDNGWSYRHSIVGQSVLSKASLLPSYMPYRSNTSTPQKLKWSAGCLGFAFDVGYNTVRNFAGIDGLGNNTKGYLRDDLFRFVPVSATRIGGATYQGSNFVSMYMGNPQNSLEFGVLLGWDSSNESIL